MQQRIIQDLYEFYRTKKVSTHADCFSYKMHVLRQWWTVLLRDDRAGRQERLEASLHEDDDEMFREKSYRYYAKIVLREWIGKDGIFLDLLLHDLPLPTHKKVLCAVISMMYRKKENCLWYPFLRDEEQEIQVNPYYVEIPHRWRILHLRQNTLNRDGKKNENILERKEEPVRDFS